MLLEMINLEKLRRAILYGLFLLAVLFIQNIILSRIVILGARPFIVPLAVVAVGFFQGGVWGGVFGLCMGILCDMSFGDAPVLLMVVLPAIGFFSGVATSFFVSKRLLSFAGLGVAALLVTGACQAFRFLVFKDAGMLPLLLTVGLQSLWALPFVFAIFYPARKISGVDLSK